MKNKDCFRVSDDRYIYKCKGIDASVPSDSVVSWSYSALTCHFISEMLIRAMLLRIASCLANWNHWVCDKLNVSFMAW